jgi:SAM-dependent methyltransferase
MREEWTAESLRELALEYMPSAVLLAAAELDIFSILASEPMGAEQLAATFRGDLRATTILADALASMGLLVKDDGKYHLAPGTVDALTPDGSATQLPFMQHHANSLRAWAQLAEAVKTGRPAEVGPSIRGFEADRVAYQEIMAVNASQAPEVVAALGNLEFDHLLDVGCGPGSWSIALLRAVPGSRATLYDLPDVLPITRRHVEAAGLSDRVEYMGGDYRSDPSLPGGADLVWISAVAHQNSREENRELLSKAHTALQPGGHLMVRDIVMDATHTDPFFGAMFAVTMLVRTRTGSTYSFEELEQDLDASGFEALELFRHGIAMNSIIRARRRDTPE